MITKQSGKKKIKNQYRAAQLRFIWIMLLLPIVSWLVFWLYVNFSSFVQAFQDTVGNWSFMNFVEVWKSVTAKTTGLDSLNVAITNTLKYFFLNIFVQFPLQIIFSYFIYKKITGYKFFRIVFYFPVIISSVAMTGVFKEFISPLGPLGDVMRRLGVDFPSQGLLGQPETATNTIMAYNVYTCVGVNMLLICGAMARIPVDVLESARLDGIGGGRELVQIIIPMIWPTLSTLIVLTCTQLLNSSGPILLLASDSYSLGTTTISYWIFDKVYAGGSYMKGAYNLVSATGLCFTIVTVPIILLIRWAIEKVPAVEY